MYLLKFQVFYLGGPQGQKMLLYVFMKKMVHRPQGQKMQQRHSVLLC